MLKLKKRLLLWLLQDKAALIRALIQDDPFLAAQIYAEDFLGLLPKRKMDDNALQFLAANKNIMEPWLITLSYRLQKEKVLHGDKGSFYDGALLVIRLMYAKAIKFMPQRLQENKPAQPAAETKDPIESFIGGMKGKNNGQEQPAQSEEVKL